ncbi:glucose-1-phosphate thymidylyltransferase [Streptomyces sp. bgisy084]|uniref:glucose-1-phosphate thymidylyltransferase n=1 Tax=Streptomyces sp. bgisy084 TaxID=3413777 RepID=UPI003D70704B
MKALVLSGGAGTRLRPITHTSAKQLVPVANKPILFHVLETIAATGVIDVGMIVGETGPEIQEAVGHGSQFGLQVTYLRQSAPLGLAHAVLIARDYLGDDDVLMYLGDNFISGGITDAVEQFRKERPDAQLVLSRVPDPTAFGVAELDAAGRVVGLEEKPHHPKSDLALVGVYLFTPAVHQAVRAIRPSARGELEITDAVQWMLEAGLEIRSGELSGYWRDTGSVADMLEVNRMLLESQERRIDGSVDDTSEVIGRVSIASGATVRGSRIVGPAVIGSGTVVTDSYIGPSTSIAEDCCINDSELASSIVLRGASFESVRRVEGSLVGRNAQVTLAPRRPVAHRLVLGDHAKVHIQS